MGKSEVFNVVGAFALEKSYGVINTAADGFKFPIKASTVNITRNDTDTTEFDGKYVAPEDIKGNFTGSGAITFRLRPKSYGYFLQMLFGDPASVIIGAGPTYTHTYTAASTTPYSFQMEINRADVDAGSEFELFKGLVITSIANPLLVEGQLEITVNVSTGIAQTYAATTAFSGTVTDLTTETDVFNSFDGSFTSGTTIRASAINMTIERPAELHYEIGDNGAASDYYYGKFMASGDAEIVFANKDVMVKALAGTPDTLSVAAGDGTNSCTYTFATMEWKPTNQQPDSATLKQLVTVPWKAYGSVVVDLINSQTSYPAVA